MAILTQNPLAFHPGSSIVALAVALSAAVGITGGHGITHLGAPYARAGQPPGSPHAA